MPEDLHSPAVAIMEPPGDAAAVVQFEGVSIAFDVKPVLQDISFSVERGQTLVLLGPAGCGKSVLLKLTNGLLLPDSGSVRVFGEDIARLRRRDLPARNRSSGRKPRRPSLRNPMAKAP